MRNWAFTADMNLDSHITISDVWLWIPWLFYYPGDFIIQSLINNNLALSKFLELDHNSYGGFLSGLISFFIYSVGISIVINTPDWFYEYKKEIKNFSWKKYIDTRRQAEIENSKLPLWKRDIIIPWLTVILTYLVVIPVVILVIVLINTIFY